MKILFYHTTCPHPYTVRSFANTALGGTESSLLRVAHEFAARGHTVYLAEQHFTQNEEIDGVHYVTLETAHRLHDLDFAVLLQNMRGAPEFAEYFPKAKKFLWFHNMPSKYLYRYKALFLKTGMELIGVSDFHAARIKKRVESGFYSRIKSFFGINQAVPVHCIYNSISADFKPMNAVVDPNKLISMSAPTKGLDLTLQVFARIKQRLPALRLYVARPWVSDIGELPEGVTFLGALPQAELRKHVAESLCVFYPQWKRVETFGLVYAEANAIGTPFLAHPLGAAPEVLSNPCQLVNGQNDEELIEKIREWQEKRPAVWLKDEFKLANVMRAWESLLKL